MIAVTGLTITFIYTVTFIYTLFILAVWIRIFIFRHNHAMASPAFNTTHGLNDVGILPVLFPNNYKVNQMPVFRARMYPGCPVAGRKANKGVGNKDVIFCACLEKKKTTGLLTQ